MSSNDSASPRWGTSTGGTLVVVISYVTTVAFSESKHPSALIRAISLNRYDKMTHLHMATFRTICSLTVRYFLNSILEWLFHGTHGISFCKRLFLGQFSQQWVISATAEKDILVSFRSSFRVVFCVSWTIHHLIILIQLSKCRWRFGHFSPAGWARSNEQIYIPYRSTHSRTAHMPSSQKYPSFHPIRPYQAGGWRVVRFR